MNPIERISDDFGATEVDCIVVLAHTMSLDSLAGQEKRIKKQ